MEKTYWFDLWRDDVSSVIATMIKNMAADIAAGYDPCGAIIKREQAEITEYREKIDRQLLALACMEPRRAEHWCRVDLIRRGAIA